MNEESMYKRYLYPFSKTCVFWDVDDWPTSNFENPRLIYSNIKSGLQKDGCYRSRLLIRAYGDKQNTLTDDIAKKFMEAGFVVENRGDKHHRVHMMLEDILNWSRNISQRANLVVLSHIREESDLLYILLSLKARGHNVVLARKTEASLVPFQTEIREWTCPNLIDGDQQEDECCPSCGEPSS